MSETTRTAVDVVMVWKTDRLARNVEPCQRLALANPRAQVDVDGFHPAGNFGTEGDLVLGGQGPGGGHRPWQGALGGGHDADLAGRRARRRSLRLRLLLGGGAGRELAPTRRQPESEDHDPDQGSDRHPTHDKPLPGGKSDEDVDRGNELEHFLEEVCRLPRETVDPALEDLHQHEEGDAGRRRLPPGLAHALQARPPERAHVDQEPD